MRKFIYLISFLLVLGVTSCKEFLNVTPKNVISMEDLQSIKQALSSFLYSMRADGDAYGMGGTVAPFGRFYDYKAMMLYTGEWDLSNLAADDAGMTVEDVEQADWRSEDTQTYWRRFYKPIGLMNLLIHEAKTAMGDEDMRDYIMGEAYVMRAYCFFKLVQYFAPYDNNKLGIPLCLNSYDDFEDVNLSRAPQTEVYAQILSDLHEAEIRLERTPMRDGFNRMYDTHIVNRLFAQVYCFKALSPAAEVNDWKNAILYATKETDGVVLESDPNKLSDLFNPNKQNSGISTNEAALRFRMSSSISMNNTSILRNAYISNEFVNTYFPVSEGDIRNEYYFTGSGTNIRLDKHSTDYGWSGDWGIVFVGFRLAETFLIQAEALAMTDQLNEAKAILECFKEARYTGTYTIPSDKEGLLQEIYRERRKEFVGEGDYVWMDMKRLGLKAERTIIGQTYTLNGAGDYRYTFPIPTSELENNKYLDQNPVWQLKD
ncbi:MULTISPECIES: RagB/SusD family nutrient uptake outer membrane protein [Butyricimonas]|uniref:RagB/SusD family nutrient uptake outer membrane protein n=1 Tax=Butyricimonas TaxID=574697 RepID=UPI001D096436|nr:MULTISPECIES: RagB/SusD family nutrient uptake outer membrane protein [Butyricimonas]MCB6971779.1 RagB/SusD family nutrient uptake outer membrane protein [Butyricimonas synergistica]MCG4518613.1 RagB/SusD family nutrient uptake outer membrane protein [Butyricimonas sp. DFI.6.44]